LVEGDWHEIKLGLVGAWQDGPARVAIRFHRRTRHSPSGTWEVDHLPV